jgi:hypothetical protein
VHFLQLVHVNFTFVGVEEIFDIRNLGSPEAFI